MVDTLVLGNPGIDAVLVWQLDRVILLDSSSMLPAFHQYLRI
jgi:hypothetical protein